MIEGFILKIKRGESPFFRFLRKLIKGLASSHLPVPRFLYPIPRLFYHLHFGLLFGLRWLLNYFYREPLFRSRCVSIGKQFHMWLMPDIAGHPKIYIGDNVNFFGHVGITSGRVFDNPTLRIHDRVDIGHNVGFLVNKEIVIEEDVNVASGVCFMDSDAHPKDPVARAQHQPPPADEIKPVHICRHVWIGQNTYVMKGVTIGEGAVIGVNSVVVSDIPPYCVAMGNPARVVFKNLPKAPSTGAADAASDPIPAADPAGVRQA
jgi:acetyltransferase-like isoleucine patch superfamily enzyme